MMAGKALDSTFIKTKLSAVLHALSGRELSTLDGYFKSGGKTKVPESIKGKIDDSINNSPDPQPT